jgi:hypothetical protein
VFDVSKPSAVTTAVRALYLSLAVGFTASAIYLATGGGVSLPLPLAIFFVPSLLFRYGVPALLVHGISTRKNWARIIYFVSFLLGMLIGVPTLYVEAARLPVLVAVDGVLIVIQIYSLSLLFTRSSNQWFRGSRAA